MQLRERARLVEERDDDGELGRGVAGSRRIPVTSGLGHGASVRGRAGPRRRRDRRSWQPVHARGVVAKRARPSPGSRPEARASRRRSVGIPPPESTRATQADTARRRTRARRRSERCDDRAASSAPTTAEPARLAPTGCEAEPGGQPAQRPGRPPVPPPEHRHQARDEERADDRRVEGDRDRGADAELLDERDARTSRTSRSRRRRGARRR